MKVRFKTYEEMKLLGTSSPSLTCYNSNSHTYRLGRSINNKQHLRQLMNSIKRREGEQIDETDYAFSIYKKLRVGEVPRYAGEKTNYYPVYFGMLVIEEEYEDLVHDYSTNEITNIKNLLKEINYEL